MGSLAEPRIDVVDLSLPEEEVAVTLRKACTEVGFFYLVNHGIDAELVEQVFEQGKKFFDLPVEEKMKCAMNKTGQGYTAFKAEKLNPQGSSEGDSKEGFYLDQDIAPDDPKASRPLCGPSQWPDPEKLPRWKPVMTSYYQVMRQLAVRMMPYLALALDLPRDWFNQPGMMDDPMTVLRLLHYPAIKSQPEQGKYGAGAHTDYGVLTFLALEGKADGLQICCNGDASPQVWEDVTYMPGAFVVNLGDCLQRWTNDKYRSTLHRVINPGIERYSVPFFFEPDYDCLVTCIPTCCSANNPPKYPPITVGEYILQKYKSTYASYKEDE